MWCHGCSHHGNWKAFVVIVKFLNPINGFVFIYVDRNPTSSWPWQTSLGCLQSYHCVCIEDHRVHWILVPTSCLPSMITIDNGKTAEAFIVLLLGCCRCWSTPSVPPARRLGSQSLVLFCCLDKLSPFPLTLGSVSFWLLSRMKLWWQKVWPAMAGLILVA